MEKEILTALKKIEALNPSFVRHENLFRRKGLQKVLVANRGEIAKRFFLALKEEGITSTAIVTDVDRQQSWYEFSDEVLYIGDALNYADIATVAAAVKYSGADAVYPGYGFLSENFHFVECLDSLPGVTFMGPTASVMRKVGNKLDARALAAAHGVPLLKGSELIQDLNHLHEEAERIGFPVIGKLNAGGGGKGMVIVSRPEELEGAWESARRIGRNNYGDDSLYIEKYIEKPIHIEVQIFNGTAIGIRKCAVQRRNQKIIEEAGDEFLENGAVLKLLAAAENMAGICGYNGCGAGTVEFLYDAADGNFGFLEVNTRLQVEYPVTDQSLRIDLVRWQIMQFDGRGTEIPYDYAIRQRFTEKDHAIECRIYAEDPQNFYSPAPGVIKDLELPTFNGIRCDFGFRKGDTILKEYDPMIGKLIARGRSREECIRRIERALEELYVKGITTNIDQLLRIVRHKAFRSGEYTNRLLDDFPELAGAENETLRKVRAGVFTALCDLYDEIRNRSNLLTSGVDLEAIQNHDDLYISVARKVEMEGLIFKVDFMQTAGDIFTASVNGQLYGSVQISARDGSDDFLIQNSGRSFPVKLDRRSIYTTTRIMQDDGRMHYYRLNVSSVDKSDADTPGTVRTPFQASFVQFAKTEDGHLQVGNIVKKGQHLIVVSAMKMETVIEAPVDGKIVYIIAEGDTSRLIQGKTAQGQIIGRPLAEGEILFLIEAEESDTKTQEYSELTENGLPQAEVDYVSDLASVLDISELLVKGYCISPAIRKSLLDTGDDVFTNIDQENHDDRLKKVLLLYLNLKQIFSYRMGAGYTWFGEFNRFVQNWDDETYTPPLYFRRVLKTLFEAHGLRWTGGKKNPELKRAVLFLFRGILFARNEGKEILCRILRNKKSAATAIATLLSRIVIVEQAERDDSLATEAKALLLRSNIPPGRAGALEEVGIKRNYLAEFKRYVTSPFISVPGLEGNAEDFIREQFENPGDLIPDGLSEIHSREIERRIETWQRDYTVRRFNTALNNVSVFELQKRADSDGAGSGPVKQSSGSFGSDSSSESSVPVYIAIAWPAKDLEMLDRKNGTIIASPALERAAIDALRWLALFNSVRPGAEIALEVMSLDCILPINIRERDPESLDYQTLRKLAGHVVRFFLYSNLKHVILHLAGSEIYAFNLYVKRGRLCLDLIQRQNRNTHLWDGKLEERNQRLYDRHKWPADVWTEYVFDSNSSCELVVPSIDLDGESRRPVGAVVYEGKIRNRPALFFIKDSRIAGGSTGDYEGRKYVAACYYSYLKDIPLYVWNDGAGANIKQGMVSLNRAAEGFMMNSLLAEGVNYERFLTTTHSSEDPVLLELFKELDSIFSLQKRTRTAKGPENFFITAIGVGSSTGLDVYGSSQASIQIMLDAEESYRVLTGSNVIKTVTGEDLTNYEIGGARVMGQWTGTVDMVARDRIDLIQKIRAIHEVFAPGYEKNSFHLENQAPTYSPGYDVHEVLSENLIRRYVTGPFLSFKGEYEEGQALVGGFAKIGRRPVLIMGPRTNFGIRSFASVIKARELMRTAIQTRSAMILVFGKRWYRGIDSEDEMALQARIDFIRSLFKKAPPRIHIITDYEGLFRITINSQADAIIFVKPENPTEKANISKRAAHFEVSSMAEAFSLSEKLIHLIMKDEDDKESPVPGESFAIPEDPVVPFNMLNVISSIVDKNSFLEYQGHTKSTLVTGLARLNGKSIGIIADQPEGGGAPDAPGTEKFRIFMEFLERHTIPLLMLSNAPGFIPGTKQERLRIQQIGGESLNVNCLSQVPVVSVVLNQNYGGRQIHAYSKYLRPGIASIALDRAILAVMGAPAAFDLFHGRQYSTLINQGQTDEAEKLRTTFLAEFQQKSRAGGDALQTGVLDWTVSEQSDLRYEILKALTVSEQRVQEWQSNY